MKKIIALAVIIMAAITLQSCVAADHGHCRPEYMVGYGDKR